MELPQEELDRLDPARLEALAEPALREVAIRLLHALKEARAGQDARVIPLARCRALFDQFPLGIAVADGAGNIIETNPAADHLMGVTAAEHRRRPIDSPDWVIIDEKGQPLPPSDYPPVRALRRKITVKDEVIGRVDEQGGVTWLSVTAAPLAEDGRGVVITFEDVTERRAAEAIQRQLDAARERKGHLRNMAAALPVIAWWTKPDGTREFFNRHYSDFLGLDPGQVTGETQEWSPAIHPDDVDSYLQLIKTALRRRKSYDVELRVQRHDGEYRWINAMGRPWWGPDGDYFGVVGIAVDVTDRKQAELALRESNVRLREHAEKLAQLASQLSWASAFTSHLPPLMAMLKVALASMAAVRAAEAALHAAVTSSSAMSACPSMMGLNSSVLPRSVAMLVQATPTLAFTSPATATRPSTAALRALKRAWMFASQLPSGSSPQPVMRAGEARPRTRIGAAAYLMVLLLISQ